MKDSELIKMQKQIESLIRLTDFLLHELDNIRTLSVGTFKTLKNMEGYDDAVKKITEEITKKENNELE